MKRRIYLLLGILSVILVAFCGGSRLPEILKKNFIMTLGNAPAICTAEDRIAYLKKHPQELHVAMLGAWEHYEQYGFPFRAAMELAAGEINQAGGVAGRRLQLHWFDNANLGVRTQELAEQISENPAFFAVFGPLNSGRVIQFGPIFQNRDLLHIAPFAQNYRLGGASRHPLLLMPTPSDQAEVQELVRWANQAGRNDFLLANQDSPFAMGYAGCLERLFFESNLAINARVLFDSTTNTSYIRERVANYYKYFPIRNTILVIPPDCISIHAPIARWMLSQPGNETLFCNEYAPFDRIQIQPQDKDRVFFMARFPGSPQGRQALRRLLRLKGYERDFLTPDAYRSIYLFADAFARAGSLNPKKVAAFMKNETLHAPTGEFRFGADGFEQTTQLRVLSCNELEKRWAEISGPESAANGIGGEAR